MGFGLLPKSVTLNDVQCIGRYFALLYRIW